MLRKNPTETRKCMMGVRRLGRTVNYIFSYRGYGRRKGSSERIPNAATPLVALRLARAYEEIGKWKRHESILKGGEKPSPQALLWAYLYQCGLDESV